MTDNNKNSEQETLEIIDSISVELDIKYKEIEDLRSNANELEQKRGSYILQYIVEKELFKDTIWTIKSYATSLDYSDRNDTAVMIFLIKLIGPSYVTLLATGGIELYYNDGGLTANFDRHTLIADFANKYQIKIDGAEITSRLRRMSKEIDPLIEISHLFNLKG